MTVKKMDINSLGFFAVEALDIWETATERLSLFFCEFWSIPKQGAEVAADKDVFHIIWL